MHQKYVPLRCNLNNKCKSKVFCKTLFIETKYRVLKKQLIINFSVVPRKAYLDQYDICIMLVICMEIFHVV